MRHAIAVAGWIISAVAGVALVTSSATAAEHPFILWTKQDAAALRRKIEMQPWAKEAYGRLVESPLRDEASLARLFRYAVMGDREAGQAEVEELMRMVHSPDPKGAAQWISVLRYDQLYDLLSPDERREVEQCFRRYIDDIVLKRRILDNSFFNDSRNYSRYDAQQYTRTNWLPNIIWPWKVSGNLMALALADEKLIRKTWAAYGSWQWYFDEYLCDTGFYSEEFSKMGSR